MVDAFLREGGMVVTASERAARSLAGAYHRARRLEGRTAWPAPHVLDWQSFVRGTWDQRALDDRVVLNSLQEHALWTRIVAEEAPQAVELAGAADRLAAFAMEAHHLLCAYAPQLLRDSARPSWDRDAETFSAWLGAFNKLCRDGNFISAARLSLELRTSLEADSAKLPPLLLAGFDRILPAQQAVFSAWGDGGRVQEVPLAARAARIAFHAAADPSSELTACALWSKAQLAANPDARLLVVTQDARDRRGEIERTFLRYLGEGQDSSDAATLFEFSLGVPLGQVALGRSAQLLLGWLSDSIAENELDWLLSTGHIAASPDETRELLAFVRALRRKGLERPRWTLSEFLRQRPSANLPAGWVGRITQARQSVQKFARRPQSPLAWAEFVPQLLDLAGWPGANPLASAEFQILRRWRQIVDDCASLGFDDRRMEWSEFRAVLDRAVGETLFAPESEAAPILIAGPAESAGLTADAIWFLGASEDAWPASGAPHPFIPLPIQRQAAMPHASHQLDWDLAGAMTRRLLASAPEVHFSYARQSAGVEARPSRFVAQLAGSPLQLPRELIAQSSPDPIAIEVDDAIELPYLIDGVAGGANVLTAQSRCAFQAFAIARLGANGWNAAEAGLSASERGLLLHEVLHSVWAGPPGGIRAHAELLEKMHRLASFVEDHVQRVFQSKIPERAREFMPARYLELEATRLAGLVAEWLRYESAREPFNVVETEFDARPSVAGLTLKVRLDRVDRLKDGSLLVIDYKSGMVSPKAWELPRPDDVQLPLYAGVALDDGEARIGGLVFAQIRPGDSNGFLGRVKDARATLLSGLSPRKDLVKKPLAASDLAAWREYIERMAHDFLRGRAERNPREYPRTCERCGLGGLCRVQENPPRADDGAADETADEEDSSDA
jgi:ATP-dependent helicase/nuclease subunit B